MLHLLLIQESNGYYVLYLEDGKRLGGTNKASLTAYARKLGFKVQYEDRRPVFKLTHGLGR